MKLLAIGHPASFLTVEKYTHVAVTLMLGRLGSGRGSQDAGTEVLVPQSVEGHSRNWSFV